MFIMRLLAILFLICKQVIASSFSVDIKHQVPEEFTTSQHALTKKINIVIIQGEWTPSKIFKRFTKARRIYEQCQVGLVIGDVREVKWKYSGDGLFYDLDDDFLDRYYDGAQQLLDDLSMDSDLATTKAIFLDRFDEYMVKIATSFPRVSVSADSISLNSLWITNRVNDENYLKIEPKDYSVFAHEIGHLALNDTHEIGEEANLMHFKIQKLNGQFTEAQCERIRHNLRLELILNKNIEHYDEIKTEDGIKRVGTMIPSELVEALTNIEKLPLGTKIFDSVISHQTKIKFVKVSEITDPDMVVAFRVGFEDTDNNTIFYTNDIDHWKQTTLDSRPEIIGEEISSSSLGSLIFHEFGHTNLARKAVGHDVTSVIDWQSRKQSEINAVKYFENIYRKYYQMPLRKSYFETNDIL